MPVSFLTQQSGAAGAENVSATGESPGPLNATLEVREPASDGLPRNTASV